MDKGELEKWLVDHNVGMLDEKWQLTTEVLLQLVNQREFIAWEDGCGARGLLKGG